MAIQVGKQITNYKMGDAVFGMVNACRGGTYAEFVKLPPHRAGLPGNEISFLIVPLDPAYKAGLAGHLPVKVKEEETCLKPENLSF